MPRRARIMSETGIYHVLLRGFDKGKIFESNEDKEKCIDLILNKRDTSNFNLYSYCVMENYVHLAVKEYQDNLSSCIKGISIGYVCYFNKKYGKTGQLFYDRFKSETIKDEKQLFSLIRFIHKSPLKENLVKKPGEYKWSSYNSYINESEELSRSKNFKNDIDDILSKLSPDKKTARNRFCEITKIDETDIFYDYNVFDKEIELLKNKQMAKEIIASAGIDNNTLEKNREALRAVILKLRNEHNISLRQIAEILKLHRGLVQRLSAP